MSTTNRRVVAAAVAGVLAVLTGLVVGLLSPQTSCRAAASPGGPADRFAAVPAVVGLAGGLAAATVAFVLLLGAEHTAMTLPVTAARLADADRAALIRACIYVRDRTTSRALADRLGTALGDAGVRTVEPVGARFNPAHHEAGGAAPSADPAKVGTIAAVEVAGYFDRDGRVLRTPVVTVYRAATMTDREGR